jgi:phosphoserine phosphatase
MRLLVLDVEGTLFTTSVRLPGASIDSTMWQAIALALGPEAVREEVATHKKWERGGYSSYLRWMEDTIEIHRRHGLSSELFYRLISSAKYNPGVVETLSTVDRSEFELLLISGGFRELAARAQRDFKIPHAFAACEYFFDYRGNVAAYNLLPCDFQGKIDFIRLMLREYGLGATDWLFVGDGANDVPIAKCAPISIAYRAHPDLNKIATFSITDFQDVLSIIKT